MLNLMFLSNDVIIAEAEVSKHFPNASIYLSILKGDAKEKIRNIYIHTYTYIPNLCNWLF